MITVIIIIRNIFRVQSFLGDDHLFKCLSLELLAIVFTKKSIKINVCARCVVLRLMIPTAWYQVKHLNHLWLNKQEQTVNRSVIEKIIVIENLGNRERDRQIKKDYLTNIHAYEHIERQTSRKCRSRRRHYIERLHK